MARVGVEQSVFGDPRYRILARELGVDVWSAIGRMCAIWNHCQETNSYVLTIEIVNIQFADAPMLSEALVKSGLGRKHRHGIYICGTKGRIEWLEKKRLTARENGGKGGRPTATRDEPTNNQRGLQPVSPPAPAPALLMAESKSSRPASSKPDPIFSDESREMKAARYLFGKIVANNPAAKEPPWQSWAKLFDLIFRVDERSTEDVRRLIDWSQQDAFWLKNILSPAALRKQFDRLTLAMKDPKPASPPSKPLEIHPAKSLCTVSLRAAK